MNLQVLRRVSDLSIGALEKVRMGNTCLTKFVWSGFFRIVTIHVPKTWTPTPKNLIAPTKPETKFYQQPKKTEKAKREFYKASQIIRLDD